MHATLWGFVAVATSVSLTHVSISSRAILLVAKTSARIETSEATSDADFGEGLRAGDDFWYSSMRNLP